MQRTILINSGIIFVFLNNNNNDDDNKSLLVLLAAVAQGELPDSGYRQGEETLPQSDEDGGSGGDVVRVRRDAAEMVRE